MLSVFPVAALVAAIGIGQWFRYATGTVEVVSALFLLTSSLALVGVVALTLTMAAAVATHVLVIGGNPAPAAILF